MRYVGTPAEQIDAMRQAPFWAGLEAIAPALAYDHAGVMGPDLSVPVKTAAQVGIPALVVYGTASFPFMPPTAETLSRALPHAELRALEQCGLISRTRRAQFRPCHLERERLDAAADWIETNRRIWTERFDKLEAHLRDIQDSGHG
jgi:hypothetical protein